MSHAGSRPAAGGLDEGAWAKAVTAQKMAVKRTVSIYHAPRRSDRKRLSLLIGVLRVCVLRDTNLIAAAARRRWGCGCSRCAGGCAGSGGAASASAGSLA